MLSMIRNQYVDFLNLQTSSSHQAMAYFQVSASQRQGLERTGKNVTILWEVCKDQAMAYFQVSESKSFVLHEL